MRHGDAVDAHNRDVHWGLVTKRRGDAVGAQDRASGRTVRCSTSLANEDERD